MTYDEQCHPVMSVHASISIGASCDDTIVTAGILCADGVMHGLRQLTMSKADTAKSASDQVGCNSGQAAGERAGNGSNAGHGCGCAHKPAGATGAELSQAEWQAACAEATGVLQDATEGINDAIDELRYALADLQGSEC